MDNYLLIGCGIRWCLNIFLEAPSSFSFFLLLTGATFGQYVVIDKIGPIINSMGYPGRLYLKN